MVFCCLPFKIYSKKLATGLATILMRYSRIESSGQVLVFNTLFHLVKYLDKQEFFDLTIKKMYVEFAKESKIGGGGHSVQNSLRTSQNCFVEMLSLNLPQSYSLGFLHIRQLCLHLRNSMRDNQDAVKNVYSW